MTAPPPSSALFSRRRTITILAVFLTFWALWLAGLGFLRYTQPGPNHGDPTTDANILNAGENFDREGLRPHYGIPAVDTFRGPDKKPDYYVTYPPGAYWFHQSLKACGIDTLPGFRITSLLISGFAVLVLLALLWRLTDDILPAAVACTLYLTAKPFIEYGDNLHYISLSQLTLFAALYTWTRFEDAQSSRASALWLIAAAAVVFLDSWLTFEHALFILAFAALRVLWKRRPGRLVAVAILGLMPALVLGIRILLDRAVLGSFDAVFAILRAKADQRIGSASVGTGLSALLNTWPPRLGWPGSPIASDHPDAEFAIPFLSWWIAAPSLALLILAIGTWHLPDFRPIRRALGVALLLLIAGLTWFFAMTEHAIVHRFTARLLLPGIATLIGALIAAGFMQRSILPRGAPARWFGRGLAAFTLIAWIGALHTAFAVNRVAAALKLPPPSAEVHAANQRRDQALAAFAAAGRSLREVDHVLMYTYDAPAARALGRPFDNTPNTVPSALSARQALLIPLWWPDARRAAAKATAALGLPDQIGPAIDPYLLFRSGRTDADRVNVSTRAGLQLTRIAFRPTLDGAGYVFAAEASGPLDELRAAGFTLELRRSPAAGKAAPLIAIPIPDTDGQRDGDHALLRAAFPSAALADARAIDIRAVLPNRPRRSGFDVEKSATLDAAGATITEQVLTLPLPPRAPSNSPTPPPEPQPER